MEVVQLEFWMESLWRDMMFKESIKMSWENIVHNKMRSFLTVLGIFIGVASIIALITIVQSATNSITDEVSALGANSVTVSVSGTALKSGLTQSEIDEFYEIDNVTSISPSVSGMGTAVYNNEVLENITISGQNEVYFNANDDIISAGREINIIDIENYSNVCLVGANIVDELFPVSSPIGETISINGISYTIVGILEESDSFTMSSSDNTVIVPYTTAMSLTGTGYISSFEVYIEDESLSETTTEEIEQLLYQKFNYDDSGYMVINMQSMVEMMETMTSTLSLLLAGIAGIALVVGGIGIMNMMLVTVKERTSEIGLRKALGAKPKDIQTQFILEALFLAFMGGVFGLLGGIALSYLGCLLMDVSFSLVMYSIPLSVGFSLVIGLVFGLLPAKRASELNPIDALRSI